MLERTTDTSLLRFKKILVAPGNAILIRDAIIYGFYADCVLKKRLSAEDQGITRNEIVFPLDSLMPSRIMKETGSIKSLSPNHLIVTVNKYYTVFGEFYEFREAEQNTTALNK